MTMVAQDTQFIDRRKEPTSVFVLSAWWLPHSGYICVVVNNFKLGREAV